LKRTPAKAEPVEAPQLAVGEACGQQAHAQIGAALFRERIGNDAIVHPVHRRLHDNAALDAERQA